MKKQDFNFELPHELIAQYPLPNRSDSRLLRYQRKTKTIDHQQFSQITDFFEPGDLLVMNDTRVIPARLYGRKASGGNVELLVERITSDTTFLAHIKASKSPKPGTLIHLSEGCIKVVGREDDLFCCQLETDTTVDHLLQQCGHIPLPPYISRDDNTLDVTRYQTVYARYNGSVAAPTAGLHFDEAILTALRAKGVTIAYVTLHVGAGTFRPVRCDNILEHKMHSERIIVTEEVCALVNQTHEAGKRVIAVGTTALRSLESAATEEGILKPCQRDTDIFIYPGYRFKICDGLITNFHLPESTLLMLVSAFIGYEEAMALYQTAIAEGYRFFSYGDTSLLC